MGMAQGTTSTQQPTGGFNVNQAASQGLQAAMSGTAGEMGYTPLGVSAPVGQATGYQGTGYNAAQMQAGQLAGTNLNPYMNPYTQNVIDTSMADLERQRQMQMSDIGGRATAAKAFGGSRHGVAESLTNEAALRQGGQLASGLRQAGFQNAQQMALSDIANRMQAGAANQAALNQARQFGAGAANTANQFTAGAQNTMAQANQNAMLQAQLANQSAGLAGSQQRLGAANQMGSLSNLGFGMGQTINQNLAQQGAMQQALQQMVMDRASQQYQGFQQSPYTALSALTGALGASPKPSQTSTQQNRGLFDYLGMGLYGASLF